MLHAGQISRLLSSLGSWRITNPPSKAPTPSARNSTSSIASMRSLCRNRRSAHYDLCDRELLVLCWRRLRGAPEIKVDIVDLPRDLGDHLSRKWAVMQIE